MLERVDHIRGTLNRGSEFTSFSLPAADALVFSASASLFGIDLVAQLALLGNLDGVHDKFHTAGFTCAVFSIAMLSEVTPFPVAAAKSVLVKKTHVLPCFLQSWSVHVDRLTCQSGSHFLLFPL